MLDVARRLLSACDGWSADRALVDSAVEALRAPLAAGAPWRAADSRQSALAPWIALLAALLLMAELLVRRPRESSA